MQTVTPGKLREAIGVALRDGMSSPEVERFCTGIGLAPPDPEQDDRAERSKRAYVVRRLAGKRLPELLRIATQVLDECKGGETADNLARLVAHADGGGVAGEMKNLLFATVGPKPKVVLRDAINNDLELVANEQHCLVYDRPWRSESLTLRRLGDWWAEREQLAGASETDVWRHLLQRLARSLDNDAERRIFNVYARRYARPGGGEIPVLLPQVYLSYDPYPQSRYGSGDAPLARQRMDFLLLFPGRVRVVIECDGVQHYADDPDPTKPDERPPANPRRYAEMVTEDRALRLRGYEVYRFGGYELMESNGADRRIEQFFDALAARHQPAPT
ncbi:hypothetical protein [Micromonospora endophytica]|uniref:Uncharacterized protein n=1 Tax=Micromonospora endophytica TaxID=515350 RepID=A0A2W2CY99_9ACTN|nr:hypothetical protein [Micromonospora endophytica]PZF98344.1 hypothetical protein C1I93_09250 [Micromonospora endophytica]RIW43232.1 hypothetical protein D3H59_20900 [Micromonospora endophytica]BCJ61541.1 hypothetical protein Jiend_49630 [Micromonospora endophytica]